MSVANCHQVPETHIEELEDTLEEVNLKLALWTNSSDFAQLTEAWRAAHFEALDILAMEESIQRWDDK